MCCEQVVGERRFLNFRKNCEIIQKETYWQILVDKLIYLIYLNYRKK